ncbi:hypothetical protein D3C81_1072550 [compost metagenome]
MRFICGPCFVELTEAGKFLIGRRSWRIQRLQLRLDGRDVGIEQVVEQAALGRTQLLTTLGKLITLESGDFVCELLDDCLVAVIPLPSCRFAARESQPATAIVPRMHAVGQGTFGRDWAWKSCR